MNEIDLVILAAGQGSRLRPLTNCIPKGGVQLNGISIIDRNLIQIKKVIKPKIICVTGHASEYFEGKNYTLVHNDQYATTNMVWSLSQTLSCIKNLTSESILISYGDIIVHHDNVQKLINNRNEFVILSDQSWETLWKIRTDDYMSDVETFKHQNEDSISPNTVTNLCALLYCVAVARRGQPSRRWAGSARRC